MPRLTISKYVHYYYFAEIIYVRKFSFNFDLQVIEVWDWNMAETYLINVLTLTDSLYYDRNDGFRTVIVWMETTISIRWN